LLDHLETPGIDIELMLKRVRRDVVVNSQGQQVPWAESSLLSSFQLAPRNTVSGDVQQLENIRAANNPSLLSVLSTTGFSQKPVLRRISNGLVEDTALAFQNATQRDASNDMRSSRIKALLCTVLESPVPESCRTP